MGLLDVILGHILIALKPVAVDFLVRHLYMRIAVRPELMVLLVPIEFIALECQALWIQDTHPAMELLLTDFIEIDSRVALDVSLDVHLLIELSEQNAFIEYPAGRVPSLIDLPTLGNKSVFYDSGIGY